MTIKDHKSPKVVTPVPAKKQPNDKPIADKPSDDAEARGEALFASSHDVLEALAAEALAERKAGKTIPVNRKES